MFDVARAVGVSKSTVSRALSGDRRVKPSTRERIRQAADSLGYTPHRVASALARGQTWMAGVVTPSAPRSFSDPFYLDFLGGLGDTVTRAGYSLVITPSGAGAGAAAGHTPAASLPEIVAGRMVDGVVLTEVESHDARIELLRAHGMPVVVLGSPEDDEGRPVPGVASVDGDNLGGARMAAEHLLGLGHREVGFIGGPSHLVAARRRRRAFLLAMDAAGWPVLPHRVENGDFTQEGGYEAMRRMVAAEKGARRPRGRRELTAVFAANDLMAIGALSCLRDLGVPVPGELSLVGFDGIGLARLVDPPLSTVAQPIHELGERVGTALLSQLARPPVAGGGLKEPPVPVVLPVRIQEGRSTAPPGRG